MAVEDHPKFPEFSRAFDKLQAARAAKKVGDAKQVDVDQALAEYDRVCAELGEGE